MAHMLWLVTLTGLVITCKASHFRGGTITWKPTENLYEAEFTYRLGYRYLHGPGCNETLVNQYINKPSSTWVCTSGCSSQITIANYGYICLAASSTEEWELGEFSFKHTFDSSGPFTISYTSGAWIALDYPSGGGNGDWSLETTVDFGLRSDTQHPNHIPTLLGKPSYTILFGCKQTIGIPVLDDDNDNIKCRWANESSECGSVCGVIPFATLHESNCSITIDANHKAGGTYALAIMVEDYPQSTITIDDRVYTPNDVISKSPYQFLVVTPEAGSLECNKKPEFVTPTPVQSSTISTIAENTLTLSYYATSTDTTIASMLVIGPPGVNQSTLQQDPSRPDVYFIDVEWTPTVYDVGSATLCVEATDALGMSSILYCLTVDVIDINDCASNPCWNGATCIDLINEYVCQCSGGYTDTNCQTDINECASDPCMNGATCFDIINDYVCVCPGGYTDTNCQTDINECASDPCMNGATCIDLINEYVCVCSGGYTDTNCQTDINECASNPCMNGATCIDLINEYVCVCPVGYTDTNCQTDINECESDPCMNGATCIDLINEYVCVCPVGYTDTNCQTDINECASDPCMNGATCIDLINEYVCVCPGGYTDTNCQTDINECASDPCMNGATCIDLINEYVCVCPVGYTDTNCQTDINECASDPCMNGATCIDLINEYVCQCSDGYTDTNCQTDINECASDPCMNGATCIDLINEYVCVCPVGYTDTNCQTDINECASNPCMNGATCIDLINEYVCQCSDGYTDTNCQTDINECASDPCMNGATCIDLINEYVCVCPGGYTDTNCQTNINECASDPCMNGATCFDLINEYFCGCTNGYTDTNCQTDINECEYQDCLNGGTCIDTIGSAVCSCKPGFTGAVCQTGINHCDSNPCVNDATCVYNETTGYQCICLDGWSGINCAYRHENKTFASNFAMTGDYMHYSSCKCFFGHGKQELCYNYNKLRGSLFGLLGGVLGFLTSILMYITGLCCMSTPIQDSPNDCIDVENSTKAQIIKTSKGDMDHDQDENDDTDGDKTSSKGNTNQATDTKHMHCYACAVKHNQIPAPRYWCDNKPYY